MYFHKKGHKGFKRLAKCFDRGQAAQAVLDRNILL